MPCPRSPRVGAAPEHLGGASVVRAVQGRRGPGRGPARWWSSALRTGSRGPESWGAGPGDWSPGVLFCLGWSLTARVLSGARLLPFLSWGADAASASCRLLLPRQQPPVRHGAQSQTGVAGSRTPGPGREVAGEGPWAGLCGGGCLQHQRCLGGLRHAWTGARPPLPGPQSLAGAQESRVISGPSSFLSRAQGCCVPLASSGTSYPGCRRQRAGLQQTPGGAEAPPPGPRHSAPGPEPPQAGRGLPGASAAQPGRGGPAELCPHQ